MVVLTKTAKAKIDMTRCIVCTHKFQSDDMRSNTYRDNVLIGAMHEACYAAFGILDPVFAGDFFEPVTPKLQV